MAVNSLGRIAVKTRKLFDLRGDYTFERPSKSRVVYDLRQRMKVQVRDQLALMFHNQPRAISRSVGGCEVEVKAGVHSSFERQRSGSFRVLHEDHCARRGDGAAIPALQDSLGSMKIPAPIVRIHNE